MSHIDNTKIEAYDFAYDQTPFALVPSTENGKFFKQFIEANRSMKHDRYACVLC